MSAPYAWLITADHIDDGQDSDAGANGPRGIRAALLMRLREAAAAGPDRAAEFPDVEWFQMYDDDQELYYDGVKTGESQFEDGFQPLDDFGTPNAGCTEIRYLNVKTGKWETL